VTQTGTDRGHRAPHVRLLRTCGMVSLAAGVLAIGAAPESPVGVGAPAMAETSGARLPAPPANGVMGFVLHRFTYSVIQGKDACPQGLATKNRERFLESLPAAEAERLAKKENEREFMQRWRASLMTADGKNICTHYAHFPDRPLLKTTQSQFARGLDLDGDAGGGPKDPDTCEHEAFTSPDGEKGIDNQAYRALGCKLEWRGVDGTGGDIVAGFDGFMASGEWSQVILLRGVDSLVNDDNVEVIYGNTADRPVVDSTGKYVWHASFTVTDKLGRFRNVLRGRIVNGVLTTEPKDIRLTYFPGGNNVSRVSFEYRKGRLRMAFQPDGTLKGVLGGYQPLEVFVASPSRGGMGTAITAGIDCAGEYNTLRKYADGIRDPKTGKCTAVSTSMDLAGVPAFVNDVPTKQKIASK